MRHFISAGLGVTAGFVSALALFPAAQAAADGPGARGLGLFNEAFQRVKAEYVRDVSDTELVGGAIEVESSPGAGSKFIMSLPLMAAVQQQSQTAPTSVQQQAI